MGLISYTRDIPFATNNPSTDQPDMETNTNHIDDLIGIDHVSFNTVGVQNGYHKVIHQTPEVADPAAIPGIGQVYVKTVGSPSDQQLFFESGGGVVSQITPPFTTGTGLQVITNVASTVMTLPNDCIGFIDLHSNTIAGVRFTASFTFFSKAGTLYVQSNANYQNNIIVCTTSGLNFQVSLFTGVGPLNSEYKFIYWSV